jgi:hypothetical protein
MPKTLPDQELRRGFQSLSRGQLEDYLLKVVRQLEKYQAEELTEEERDLLEKLKKEKKELEKRINQLNERNKENEQIYEENKILKTGKQELFDENQLLSKKNKVLNEKNSNLEKELKRAEEKKFELQKERDTLKVDQVAQVKVFRQLDQEKNEIKNHLEKTEKKFELTEAKKEKIRRKFKTRKRG